MSSEVVAVRSFIAWVIKNDALLQSKIANRYYAGIATPNAGDFYIVYSYVTGNIARKLARMRRPMRFLYDLKVYQKGSGNADFSAVVDKVDELFSNQINVEHRGYYISSLLETPLDLPENDREKDAQWSCLGGTYRFLVSKI